MLSPPETHAQVVPVDHASSNISLFAVPTDLLFPKNYIVISDFCEQLDVISHANVLLIEKDCLTELQLESSDIL